MAEKEQAQMKLSPKKDSEKKDTLEFIMISPKVSSFS